MSGRLARVKAALRSGEVRALSDLYGRALANGRNDIGTLRRERGWVIESWLMRHEEDAPFHKHYKLISEPEATENARSPIHVAPWKSPGGLIGNPPPPRSRIADSVVESEQPVLIHASVWH